MFLYEKTYETKTVLYVNERIKHVHDQSDSLIVFLWYVTLF